MLFVYMLIARIISLYVLVVILYCIPYHDQEEDCISIIPYKEQSKK